MSRRFWLTYWTALVLFASSSSLVSSFAYLADGPRLEGGPLVLLSLLRSFAPMAAGSALLLGLAVWSEALSPARLAQALDPGLKRALSLAFPGYLVSVALAFGVCFAVSAAVGVAPSRFGAWLGAVARSDFAAGLAFTLLDTTLILLLARRYGPRLRTAPISLPAKLIVIVTVTVPLRATLALVFAPFMPG